MNHEKEENEKAFACVSRTPQDGWLQEGMDLRDWFAGMALQGFLASDRRTPDVSKEAYRYADAMMEARKMTTKDRLDRIEAALTWYGQLSFAEYLH